MPMAALALALVCLLLSGMQAMGQAVPAGSGDSNPEDLPLQGQDLGSTLSLNQGVNAINAENQSFQRYGLGLSASGGWITDFLDTQTNQQGAAYMQFGASGGLKLHTSRTRYYLLYQPQYYIYPSFTEVNNFSQGLFQSLTHDFSEHTAMSWSTTGARYLSLSQYLPQNLGIGGIGVVVPTPGQQVLDNSFELTNVATSLSLKHLMSPKMTFTATGIGAYFLEVPTFAAGTPIIYPAQRFVTGGADIRMDYQWTPRDSFGAAITPIYVYGVTPSGHQSAETAQVTYQRQLTSTLTATVGAGPLFVQSSSPGFGSTTTNSYAVTATISRQIRQSQFAAGYSRALLVNLLEPAVPSNTVSGNAYLPRGSHWIFSGAASYTHSSATAFYGAASVVGGSAQASYQLTKEIQLFALYSLISQTYSYGTSQPASGFTRNQIGAGIQFNLGNAITHGGVQ